MPFAIVMILTILAFCAPLSFLKCIFGLCLLLLNQPTQLFLSQQDKDRSEQDNNLNELNARISSSDRQGQENI